MSKKKQLCILPLLLIAACSSSGGKKELLTGVFFQQLEQGSYQTLKNSKDIKIELCFKNAKDDPICFKNVSSGTPLRITTSSKSIALSSITLLDEKPYGDKNFYYSFQQKQLKPITIPTTTDAKKIYIGTIFISIIKAKNPENYPHVGIAIDCTEDTFKKQPELVKGAIFNCLAIGSLKRDADKATATSENMPPKPMYRPFGRDPDVPFGEIPESMSLHD